MVATDVYKAALVDELFVRHDVLARLNEMEKRLAELDGYHFTGWTNHPYVTYYTAIRDLIEVPPAPANSLIYGTARLCGRTGTCAMTVMQNLVIGYDGSSSIIASSDLCYSAHAFNATPSIDDIIEEEIADLLSMATKLRKMAKDGLDEFVLYVTDSNGITPGAKNLTVCNTTFISVARSLFRNGLSEISRRVEGATSKYLEGYALPIEPERIVSLLNVLEQAVNDIPLIRAEVERRTYEELDLALGKPLTVEYVSM